MSVLASIAYGIIDLNNIHDHDKRKEIQQAARMEAHAAGYWISGCCSVDCCQPYNQLDAQGRPIWSSIIGQHLSNHKLTRWNKNTFRDHRRYQQRRKPGVKDRANPIHKGTFAECCRALTAIITPSNHETT